EHYRGLIAAVRKTGSESEWIRGSEGRAITDAFESVVRDGVSAAHDQVIEDAVSEAKARRKIRLLGAAQPAVVHVLERDSIFLQQGGEGRRESVIGIVLIRSRFRNQIGGVDVGRSLNEITLRVMSLIDSREVFPADAEVQGQPWGHLPVVLKV